MRPREAGKEDLLRASLPQPTPMSGRRIMADEDVRRAVTRISHEIVEKQAGTEGLVLVGIQRRGVPLAHRLAASILEHEGAEIPVGALDITFYRDDLSLVAQQPIVKGTQIPFDLNGRMPIATDTIAKRQVTPRWLGHACQVAHVSREFGSFPRRKG